MGGGGKSESATQGNRKGSRIRRFFGGLLSLTKTIISSFNVSGNVVKNHTRISLTQNVTISYHMTKLKIMFFNVSLYWYGLFLNLFYQLIDNMTEIENILYDKVWNNLSSMA